MTSYKIQSIPTIFMPKIAKYVNIKNSFNIDIFIINVLEMYFL